MNFYYESDGVVRPWTTPGIVLSANSEEQELFINNEEREWENWHANHKTVKITEVVHSTVKTTFSGLGEPLGMFYVTVYDARGKEMDEIQCLTMEKAILAHDRCVKELRQAMRKTNEDYYPSIP